MAKRKLAPLPRVTSKTITVGALLRKIKRLILAEPKRLDMGDYVSMLAGKKIGFTDLAPACGTVACMAGWGVVLLRPDKAYGPVLCDRADAVMEDAIGYDSKWGGRSVSDLFSPHGYREFGEDTELPDAGTPEHAAVIAKRIDTYLSRHPEIVHRKILVADVQKALRA